MKVIVAVILALGSASALGSGPYLPSGWRPQGPAFYLPTEVQKPAENPLKETILFESEAAGSEGLREYGPPKAAEEPLSAVQTLPDVVTDQTFYVLDNNVVEQQEKVKVEQKAEIVEESVVATTESQVTEAVESFQDIVQEELTTASFDAVSEVEAVTDKIEAEVQKVEVEVVTDKTAVEVATDKAEIVELVAEVKEVEAAVEEKLENIVFQEENLRNIVVQEEKLENIVVQEENIAKVVVEAVEEVKNIAETIVNIENEIKEVQVQGIEAAGEVKINQEGSGSAQVPEGFLEYGPPGFREYGPPQGDELLRSIENNETRRRRFSPKFSSLKKH